MIPWIRGWTDIERTSQANARLGVNLTFVAGATNAGGFLAVGQYTSHMTGVLVNWGLRRALRSAYGLPLLLLCFIMSLPLALVLLALVLRPIWTDLRRHLQPI